LLPRMRKIAAHLLKASDPDSLEFRDGRFFAAGSAQDEAGVTIAQVAQAWYLKPHLLPADVDPAGLEVSVGYKPKVDTGSFTYASQAAVVAVDPHTGQIEILDYVVVEDCGIMVNPMI